MFMLQKATSGNPFFQPVERLAPFAKTRSTRKLRMVPECPPCRIPEPVFTIQPACVTTSRKDLSLHGSCCHSRRQLPAAIRDTVSSSFWRPEPSVSAGLPYREVSPWLARSSSQARSGRQASMPAAPTGACLPHLLPPRTMGAALPGGRAGDGAPSVHQDAPAVAGGGVTLHWLVEAAVGALGDHHVVVLGLPGLFQGRLLLLVTRGH